MPITNSDEAIMENSSRKSFVGAVNGSWSWKVCNIESRKN